MLPGAQAPGRRAGKAQLRALLTEAQLGEAFHISCASGLPENQAGRADRALAEQHGRPGVQACRCGDLCRR